MRIPTMVLAASVAALVTACGPASASPHHHHTPAFSPAQACVDLARWYPGAAKMDKPRFTPLLWRDATAAGATHLGHDLGVLATGLPYSNGIALGTYSMGGDMSPLVNICSGYGVTISVP